MRSYAIWGKKALMMSCVHPSLCRIPFEGTSVPSIRLFPPGLRSAKRFPFCRSASLGTYPMRCEHSPLSASHLAAWPLSAASGLPAPPRRYWDLARYPSGYVDGRTPLGRITQSVRDLNPTSAWLSYHRQWRQPPRRSNSLTAPSPAPGRTSFPLRPRFAVLPT